MKKLKIKNWISHIQDRNKWKLFAEKAKTFKDTTTTTTTTTGGGGGGGEGGGE